MHISNILHNFAMYKELGKWLMDIAKYLVTAGILSYFFNVITNNTLLIIISAAITILLMLFGMYLINYTESKIDKKKKNRKWR